MNNNYYEKNKEELNRKSKQRYYKRMKIAQLRGEMPRYITFYHLNCDLKPEDCFHFTGKDISEKREKYYLGLI